MLSCWAIVDNGWMRVSNVKVYENALLVELKARGLKAESQIPLKVDYEGQIVGDYKGGLFCPKLL